jgi:hypothetical protein
MEGKKRGPKEKPEKEKKVPVRIWVKKKYYAKASKEAKAIERKYSAGGDNKKV